jgi:hypothetical protein
MSKRKSAETHTFLSIRVDSYDVRSAAGISIFLVGTASDYLSEDEDVFDSQTHLTVRGECIDPKERYGERYEVLVHGERASHPRLKVKDIHATDKDDLRVYRTRYGRNMPVFNVPRGIATLERRRDDRVWSAWVTVEPNLVTDMLIVLSLNRQSYLSIHEKRFERRRWIRDLSLQTTDPSTE